MFSISQSPARCRPDTTLANLSTVTLATLRPVQPVGECYSVASLTVCECPKIPSSTITTHTGAVIVNPKRLSYLQAGYKQLIDERPEAPRGKAAALTRYDETAETITAVYKFIPVLHRGAQRRPNALPPHGRPDQRAPRRRRGRLTLIAPPFFPACERRGVFSLCCGFSALSVQNAHDTVDCRAEL